LRRDILSVITEEHDLTHVVILTYGMGFLFFERLVLPRLIQAGNPAITIFADAQCAQQAYAHESGSLGELGWRYRVVPILMAGTGCFHPKAIFLSGKKRGILFVGSGNLGVGGWRENGETWIQFDTDQNETAPFAAFQIYLEKIIHSVPLHDAIRRESLAAFTSNVHSWAVDLAPPSGLLGWFPGDQALLNQLEAVLTERNFEELIICSPFYDDEVCALKELKTQFAVTKTTLLVQPNRSTLSREAFADLTPDVSVQGVTYRKGEEAIGFLHAKFYAFRKQDQVWLFAGSANCSRAALLGKGNAELMILQRMTAAEFDQLIVSELELVDVPLELRSRAELIHPLLQRPTLCVTGCRFEDGTLSIFYSPADAQIAGCWVDEYESPFRMVGPGHLQLGGLDSAGQVIVRGYVNGEMCAAAPAWVDHELELAKSSAERNVEAGIRQHVRQERWSSEAWITILRLLKDDLELVSGVHHKQPTGHAQTGIDSGKPSLRPEQIFESPPTLYRPNLPGIRAGIHLTSRVDGLRRLLLRWYGLYVEDKGGCGELLSEEEQVERLRDANPAGFEKTVSLQETPSKATATKMKKLAEAIVDRMTQPEYANARSIEHSARDWEVVGILLTTGWYERWLADEDYIKLSQRLWSHAFFDAGEGSASPTGYFVRLDNQNPVEFARCFYTTDMASVCLIWLWNIQYGLIDSGQPRFILTAILAMQRLPRLWGFNGDDVILTENLQSMLLVTGSASMDMEEIEFCDYLDALEAFLHCGAALGRLEAWLNRVELLQTVFSKAEVNAGDLLWQKGIGFCFAIREVGPKKFEVLTLQSETPKKYRSDFLRPVRVLLELAHSADPSIISENDDDVIGAIVGFQSTGISLIGDELETNS